MISDGYTQDFDQAECLRKFREFGNIVGRHGYRIHIDHRIHLLWRDKKKHTFDTIEEAWSFAQALK